MEVSSFIDRKRPLDLAVIPLWVLGSLTPQKHNVSSKILMFPVSRMSQVHPLVISAHGYLPRTAS